MDDVKFRLTEHFLSIQGEGRRAGRVSVFLRFFGCNLTCPGFGMPVGQKSTFPDEVAKEVHLYKSLKDLPLPKTGCDSYPSWHKAFRDFSPEVSGSELTKIICDDCSSLANGPRGIDLVITGGEPLLKANQTKLVKWFEDNVGLLRTMGSITFETNGTQKPALELIAFILNHPEIQFTFSISPKLSCSGVEKSKAIIPDVISIIKEIPKIDYYVKFVVSDELSADEALSVFVNDYGLSLVYDMNRIYFMPCGGTYEEYCVCEKKIADICMKSGIPITSRLHIHLFKNSWAT